MTHGRRKVLIIDPDVRFREEVKGRLEKLGYEVSTAEGMTKGAQMLKGGEFSCVVVDVNLPEMKGYDAVPIIKVIAPKTPVIVTAAVNTREQEAKVREQDIFYYHIKNFETEELIGAIKSATGEEKKKEAKPPRVLIVDDEPDFVDSTRLILESEGYEVEAAYNREEALKKIEESPPDLILLDIMMEKMTDGFTLCYKLKHDERYSRIPILMVTAVMQRTGFKFSPKTDAEFLEADDYIEKPLKADDLLRRIRKFIGQS